MESINSIKPVRRTVLAVRVGVLAAVAFALMYLEFHLPGFPTFLQYDAGDLPALLGGFAMGPVSGLAVVLVRNTIFLLSGKDEAGWIGTLASLVSSICLVGAAAVMYHQYRTLKGAVLGMLAGILTAAAVMGVANYHFFIPIYAPGLDPRILLALARTTVLFNLVKGSITGVLTFLVYKRVRSWLG